MIQAEQRQHIVVELSAGIPSRAVFTGDQESVNPKKYQ